MDDLELEQFCENNPQCGCNCGQLLDRGSRWYSKCYGVGKKHVEKVDEALYNLYGIKSW